MALKKPITGTTKYYYAVVTQIQYLKPRLDLMTNQHLLTLELQVHDTKAPDWLEVENTLHYRPSVGMTPVTGNPNLFTVALDPFDLAAANTNLVAQAYVWLKANIALFSDFIDA